jgi:transcriptional regulator with XRE-family HTH domain
MPTRGDLGRAIRRLRQARDLTIEVLAFKAGMSPRHLGRIEQGHGNPRLETLFGLADALGVTFEDLVRAAEDKA